MGEKTGKVNSGIEFILVLYPRRTYATDCRIFLADVKINIPCFTAC